MTDTSAPLEPDATLDQDDLQEVFDFFEQLHGILQGVGYEGFGGPLHEWPDEELSQAIGYAGGVYARLQAIEERRRERAAMESEQ